MRKIALAFILIGIMVGSGFIAMLDAVGNVGADETAPPEEPTRTDAYNKMDNYPQWSGWDDENYNQPWNQRWHNWTNYLQYYPQREFWFR